MDALSTYADQILYYANLGLQYKGCFEDQIVSISILSYVLQAFCCKLLTEWLFKSILLILKLGISRENHIKA